MIIAPLSSRRWCRAWPGMGGERDIGRIGLRSLAWFVCASLVSLALGLVLANALATRRRPAPGGQRHAPRRHRA